MLDATNMLIHTGSSYTDDVQFACQYVLQVFAESLHGMDGVRFFFVRACVRPCQPYDEIYLERLAAEASDEISAIGSIGLMGCSLIMGE